MYVRGLMLQCGKGRGGKGEGVSHEPNHRHCFRILTRPFLNLPSLKPRSLLRPCPLLGEIDGASTVGRSVMEIPPHRTDRRVTTTTTTTTATDAGGLTLAATAIATTITTVAIATTALSSDTASGTRGR